jgi:hypothetical protein
VRWALGAVFGGPSGLTWSRLASPPWAPGCAFGAPPVGPRRQACCHTWLLFTRWAQDLKPLGFGALLVLRGQHGGDGDAVDLELGVNSDDVAGFRAFEQKVTIEDAARL